MMPVRLLTKKRPSDIAPGDVIEVFDEWYRVRYITYHGMISLYLQPENEPLSPFTENDVLIISVNDDVVTWIDVEVKGA
ncbi:hypothetical protein OI906_17030 [Klebsiella pneumoniae]|uniref:hypothetical protein n=2 Tax=Klebsiella pneumoniae complex TaxID=3390273 RepID=UPI0013CFEB07|nr:MULTISPECIES: hypothetical protein [Klebsiella]WIK00771.1 hypothetical protein OI921_09905 [Klebsiella pneumoniae]WIK17813.1 hypothetical protein OI906_17030 [Klebsiella pneumoniae]